MDSLFFVAIISVSAIAIVFTLASLREKRRVELNILREKQALEVSIKSLEGERTRLSREIHDGIGPLLSLLNLYVHQLQRKPGNTSLTEKVSELLEKTIHEAHHISANLSSSALEEKGLTAAIDEYCGLMSTIASVPIEFTSTISHLELPEPTELNIYRITQELVHNAVKHSQADCIRVALEEDCSYLRLVVRDNGIGFSETHLESIPAKPHLGISNIQHRLSIIQGTLDLFTSPDKGCQIEINIPTSNRSIHENSYSRRSLTV